MVEGYINRKPIIILRYGILLILIIYIPTNKYINTLPAVYNIIRISILPNKNPINSPIVFRMKPIRLYRNRCTSFFKTCRTERIGDTIKVVKKYGAIMDDILPAIVHWSPKKTLIISGPKTLNIENGIIHVKNNLDVSLLIKIGSSFLFEMYMSFAFFKKTEDILFAITCIGIFKTDTAIAKLPKMDLLNPNPITYTID